MIDLNNKKNIIKIIKKYKPKAIFNLAAETHVDRSIDGPENFIKANINGTFSLLESLRYLKKKKLIQNLFISRPMKYMEILKKAKGPVLVICLVLPILHQKLVQII